jgi:hypothetical protein
MNNTHKRSVWAGGTPSGPDGRVRFLPKGI